MKSSKVKIAITGVAGFIGSNLATKLVASGYFVIGIDNLSKGDLDNIKQLQKQQNFQFVKCKSQDLIKLKKIFKGADVIFHLSSAKIPRYGNRLTTLQENTKSMESILEIARLNKSAFVFSSTSDVYGKNPHIPFSEESELVLGSSEVARWAYATSKIFDEHLCFAYHEEFNVPITIVRLFGVYGPRQNKGWWGGPQALFIEKIKSGQTIEIHGTGKQTRTFVFIDDVVAALEKIIGNPKAVGQIINIGSTEELTILSLAEKIAKILKKPLKIKKVPYKSFTGKKYEDVIRRKPSINKAEKILRWKPKVNLQEGLKKTVDWQAQK